MKSFVMTLDLEADFSGALHEEYALLQSPQRIRSLLDFFEERGVDLSVFAVGRLLTEFPEAIGLFERAGTEFHCHSHTHDPAATDSEPEILACRAAHLERFGKPPLGYRAPDGRITREGIRRLEKQGFKFDASIFPSYYPNPFKYLFRRAKVHVYPGTGLVEIPNTPVSPLRLMLSLSYVKLLGWPLFRAVLERSRLPETVIFGSHLHDFYSDREAIERMPWFWKRLYGRNHDKGLDWMDEVVKFFEKRGYRFRFISEIYRDFESSRLRAE